MASDTIKLLEHANYEMDYPILNKIEHTSILTGVKHIIHLGYSAKITLTVNLMKYFNPVTIYNAMKALEGTTIKFGLGDGLLSKFVDVYGNDADFFVNEVTPYYLTKTEFYDQVKIVLTSVNYLNISAINQTVIYGYGLQYGLNYGY